MTPTTEPTRMTAGDTLAFTKTLVKNHRADFEELGLLRFQTGKATGGRPEKFTMLNEDQSTLGGFMQGDIE